MTVRKKSSCPKKDYQKVSFERKLAIIDEIHNGLISVNHASKIYGISRSSITYWMQKLSSFVQRKKGMSKNDEIKKLKERIEALEFMKDLQQDIIADFERVTGQELSKKYLPETLANEIARKKKSLQSKMAIRMFRA
jgi:transposase-like protein